MSIESFISMVKERIKQVDQAILAFQRTVRRNEEPRLRYHLTYLGRSPKDMDPEYLRRLTSGIQRGLLDYELGDAPLALREAVSRVRDDLSELAYILEAERARKVSETKRRFSLPPEAVQAWVQRLRATLGRLREWEFRKRFAHYQRSQPEARPEWLKNLAEPYYLDRVIRVLEEPPLNPARLRGAAHMLRDRYGIPDDRPAVWKVNVEEGRRFVQEVLALADELDALAEALEASESRTDGLPLERGMGG